jgi:hypothetical protein
VPIALSLFGLALGPALVAILPADRLPESLRVHRTESSPSRRTLSVARALVLALLAGALVQACVTAS